MGTNRESVEEPGIILQLTSTASYRQPFIDEVVASLGDRFLILAGEAPRVVAVPSEIDAHGRMRMVKNRYLADKPLLWQSGVIAPSLSAQSVVLVFSPWVLSNWVVLVLRRLLRRRTVLWGHAWSRSGAGSRTNLIRRAMLRLSNGFLAYTRRDAEEVRRLTKVGHVWVAPNALYLANKAPAVSNGLEPTNFIISGRLVAEKKVDLAIDAFTRASARLPDDCRLVIVGDGPLRESLTRMASDLGVASRVDFLGAIYDESTLAAEYAQAICSLSPGYVGLSIIQSHFFGVPMAYAIDEPHAPEVSAAVDGVNAFPFPSDNPQALADLLLTCVERRVEMFALRSEIAAKSQSEHSAEAMAEGFVDAALGRTENEVS